jgi:hypothetical protein
LVDSSKNAELRSLEVQNQLRRIELWQDTLSETLSRADLGVSRQRLDQRRKRGTIVAVRLFPTAAYRYPRWQFDEDFKLRPELPRIIEAAREVDLSDLELHRLMLSESAGGGRPPVSMLDRGDVDRVVSIIRAAADQAA